MASNGNIAQFRYFPFLKKLVTTGEFLWETPDTPGAGKLVTRLYIDGDVMNWYPEYENGVLLDFSNEVLAEHHRKIDRDMASMRVMTVHLGMGVALITWLITWLLNPQHLLEQTIIISVLSVVGFLARKITVPLIFKLVGTVVRAFMQKRKKA